MNIPAPNELEILDPRNSTPSEFIARATHLGVHPKNARRLFGAVVGNGETARENWITRGIVSRDLAQHLHDLPTLKLFESKRSPIDGFEKLLFTTHDNLPVESVIIPLEKPQSATLCISSQVGCPMGCVFCATGKMKQRRNLATWEIVDQFIQARRIAHARGLRITGTVFMGMGEPFLNYERVIAAAQILCFPVVGAISGKAITISTVGILDKIKRYTSETFPFRLSISLGAASDEKRQLLVPVAARTPVREIMAAGREYALKRNTRLNLAYVCVGGINVSVEDAKELGRLIGDTPVRIDLITVTDPSGIYRAPSESELNTFRDALRLYVGQPVVRRYSGGADIHAACGTLAGKVAEASIVGIGGR